MTVMVALLRGVNVGGTTRVPMADLRRVVVEAGYGAVRTYVNSGNVVLTADGTDTEAVAATLRAACAAAFPVAPDVVVRTRDELHAVLAANPFLDRDDDPTHHHVVFLSGTAPARDPDVEVTPPEDLAVAGREVYLYLPHGIGRSPLAARLARRPGPAGTSRNWRTVTTLARMADEPA
ncbi:DUF1697 domain-containing protein [Cellulomonas dongxiuzhuiae]|uniref:DUF1697 domain-containing protein n=1 Tax=Cellulomonas dongxiuzhuiae TaxID=2819979 RepID=UPI001AAF881A|nr:DUF1697 domain-containing protein [Cellulomonas dongxiuzhuiae]MBO3088668.1 DUF1697 domain-containing protein [Cellulomonas dongxiuzhuiae]